MKTETSKDNKIKETVRQHYGEIAKRVGSEMSTGSCCGPDQATKSKTSSGLTSSCSTVSSRFYSIEEIADLPESVTDISLGSGNPVAMAELQPGEVVLDLGSGGGIDCFLASKLVGPEGKVIGLDMTTEMVELSRKNALKVGSTNVEFQLGEMESIPIPEASVDVIISNCVINLSPDKDAVFKEAFRVLRPGGRMVVSDIVTHGELPDVIRDQLSAWAGCIAGALNEMDYLGRIEASGFEEVEILSRKHIESDKIKDPKDLKMQSCDAEQTCCEGHGTISSVKVRARKPK
jgi:ubiquinone/menaquinone biosynthesis C-methylase UbiE